jgi:hypothetical protein
MFGVEEKGIAFARQSRLHFEGTVAKRLNGRYRPGAALRTGRRSSS